MDIECQSLASAGARAHVSIRPYVVERDIQAVPRGLVSTIGGARMSQAQQAQQAQQAHTRDQSSVDIQARAHDKRRVKVETDICFELLAPSFFAGKIKRQAHSLYSQRCFDFFE